jgi:hypothetical protein
MDELDGECYGARRVALVKVCSSLYDYNTPVFEHAEHDTAVVARHRRTRVVGNLGSGYRAAVPDCVSQSAQT